MTTWPQALRRWQRELEIFPPDVATVLGDMVTRLAPALSNAARTQQQSSGEPDGYDGCTQRGPFERLLGSEWALQQAAPLEFLRRATQGELSFLNLAQRTPAPRRGVVVLFDAGPHQLGGCRIVQLAILLALSERARRSGSEFGWQSLLHLGEPLQQAVDARSIRTFLDARTPLEAGPKAVAHWQERYADSELWVVAAPTYREFLNEGTLSVFLTDIPDPNREAILVRLGAGRQPARELTLELPEPAAAKRVLRNPFETNATLTLPHSQRPNSNLLISPDGNNAMFLSAEGAPCGVSLSQLKNERPIVRAFSAELPVVALGRRSKRFCWLGSAPGVCVLQTSSPLRRDRPTTVTCPAPDIPAGSELWPLITFIDPLSALLVAGDHSLWRLNFDTKRVELLAEGLTALAQMGEERAIAAVARHEGGPALLEIGGGWKRALPFTHFGGAAFLRTHKPARIVLASELPSGGFQIDSKGAANEPSHREILSPPSGYRVVGVDAVGDDWLSCGLYILSPDEKTLEVVGRGRSRVLVRSASPIRSLAVAASAGRVAYVTAAGALGVVGRDGRAAVEHALEVPA